MSNIPKVILLVEDNPDDELLTIRGLQKSNLVHEIVVARDGVEALDYLFGTGGKTQITPSLVLLDLKLPKMDGKEVLRRIRSDDVTKLLRVVVLTSSTEERDIEESYNLGANSYICKPVEFEKFVDSAQLLLHYWLELNESIPTNKSIL